MSDSPYAASLPGETVTGVQPLAVGSRTFLVMALGQGVSILGSELTAFALGMWIVEQTSSAMLLSLIILAATIPGVLIAPVAGSVVDRCDRRLVMLSANVVILAAELAIIGLILASSTALGYLFALAMVVSCAAAFLEPAYQASVPLLVAKEHLGRASGLMELCRGVGRIVAPVAAGVLLATVGIEGVLAFDVATFLVAVVALATVRLPRPTTARDELRPSHSLRGDAMAGWRYLRARSGLLALLFLFAGVNFIVAAVNVLYLPLLNGICELKMVGILLTVGGAGALLSSLAVTGLGTPRQRIPAIMGLLMFGGLAIALTGVRATPLWIAAALFATMAVLPVLQATSQVLWQTKVDVAMQGRVFALRRMFGQATLPLGLLLGGWLADKVFEPAMADGGALAAWFGPWLGVGPGRGLGLMFIMAGVLGVLLGLAGFLHPRIRRLEDEVPDTLIEQPPAPAAS